MEKVKNLRIILGLVFVALAGAWLFRVSLHTDDAGILAGLIFLGSALAAVILPQGWWPFAFAIGSCVIASEFYRNGGAAGHNLAMVAAFILMISGLGICLAVGARKYAAR